ncbi:MAG: hypothetical protein Q9188_004402 [Gyalolechia gomerana]
MSHNKSTTSVWQCQPVKELQDRIYALEEKLRDAEGEIRVFKEITSEIDWDIRASDREVKNLEQKVRSQANGINKLKKKKLDLLKAVTQCTPAQHRATLTELGQAKARIAQHGGTGWGVKSSDRLLPSIEERDNKDDAITSFDRECSGSIGEGYTLGLIDRIPGDASLDPAPDSDVLDKSEQLSGSTTAGSSIAVPTAPVARKKPFRALEKLLLQNKSDNERRVYG